MRTYAAVIAIISLVAGPFWVSQAQEGDAIQYTLPDQFEWEDVPFFPEVKYQVISGTPMDTGFYIIRSRFPPGVMTQPHFHSKERWITVISGTFYTGNDSEFNVENMRSVPPGTSIYQPPGAIHFDGAKDEEVIVEITGLGPVTTTFLDRKTEPTRHRIVLIGATASSAGELIDQALTAGHEVIGVSRRPEKLTVEHENFKAEKGDVYDLASIERLLSGEEIVISYIDINAVFGEEIPPGVDLFSRGTQNIILAMKAKGNRRLFVTSNISAEYVVLDDPGQDASLSDRMAWSRRHKYADVRLMETIIEGSDLDYTIMRLPRLLPGPATGEINVVVNQNSFNMAVRDAQPSRILTLADLSAFILQNLDSPEYMGKRVGLFN